MMNTDLNQVFTFCTDSRYWIERIIADAREHPGEIVILKMPEENNGSIQVRMPLKFMEIRPDHVTWQ